MLTYRALGQLNIFKVVQMQKFGNMLIFWYPRPRGVIMQLAL